MDEQTGTSISTMQLPQNEPVESLSSIHQASEAKSPGRPSLASDDKSSTKESNDDMTKKAKHHKKWNRRLKIIFCCLGYKRNKDSIADVASIFAEFYADLDVPSSDLAAGFVLLSKYQTAQRQYIVKSQSLGIQQYLSGMPIRSESNFLNISTAEDSHLINDLIYYMNYGLAIFGWPMQMVDDPCMLCCICPYMSMFKCSSVPAKHCDDKPVESASGGNESVSIKKNSRRDNKIKPDDSPEVEPDANSANNERSGRKVGVLSQDCDGPIILEDNCCGCNVASVERRLRAHNYEIIYASYRVDVNVVPFLVAADHSKQSIVVAIRGSMSLSDMITDMNGQTDKIPIDDCPDDWLSHRGITRASSYVKSKLIQERILERAFNCRPDLGSQDYNLVLCGHSLGAGVAAILGILIRKQYPNLRAYLYSPPGGILSLPAVEHTKQFAVGIILGNDCVPRLGVAQLERLRYQILLSLKSSKSSTSKILAKALCPSSCFGGGNKVDYDPSQSLDLLYSVDGRSFDYNGSKIPFQVQPQVLYVPGRLIHIVKNRTFKSRARRLFEEPIYQALWTDNVMYDRVMISEGMLYDHLPNNLMHAMKMLFSKTLPARKESKASESSAIHANPASQQSNNSELYPQLDTKDDRQVVEIRDENNNHEEGLQSALDKIQQEDDDKQRKKDNLKLNSDQSSKMLETLTRDHHSSIKTLHDDKSFDNNGNDESAPNMYNDDDPRELVIESNHKLSSNVC